MTPEPQDVKPLPCPFCGGEPTTIRRGDNGVVTVMCENDGCPVSAESSARTRHDAIAWWNRRAPSPSTGGASSLRAQIEALPVHLDWDPITQVRNGWRTNQFEYLSRKEVLALLDALCGDAHGGGTSHGPKGLEGRVNVRFTDHHTEQWSRADCLRFIRDRVGESHLDDLADFLMFQLPIASLVDVPLTNITQSEGSSGAPSNG